MCLPFAQECGLSPDQQRLFLKGKLLKDHIAAAAIGILSTSTAG